MPKEIIYASLAGSVLGLVIAFGVWRTNSAFKAETVSSQSPIASGKPQPSFANHFDLSIAKPDETDLITQTPLTVSGITKAGSWIIISAENKDYMLQAGNDGNFSQDIGLLSGVNQVVITSFDSDGNSLSKTLNLVYSTEFGNLPK